MEIRKQAANVRRRDRGSMHRPREQPRIFEQLAVLIGESGQPGVLPRVVHVSRFAMPGQMRQQAASARRPHQAVAKEQRLLAGQSKRRVLRKVGGAAGNLGCQVN